MSDTPKLQQAADSGLSSHALFASSIGRVLTEYRNGHEAAEYPHGRGSQRWPKSEEAQRFREEYCKRPPESESMAILQSYLRLQEIELECSAHGGRQSNPIGVWQALDVAALSLANAAMEATGLRKSQPTETDVH